MNLTISVDAEVLRKARALAQQRGVSLQDMLREYLETLVGKRPGNEVADELLALMAERPGRSGGRKVLREEAYEDRW